MAEHNDTSRSLALAALLASREQRGSTAGAEPSDNANVDATTGAQPHAEPTPAGTGASGAKPDTIELWQWMQSAPGEFDAHRAAEIRSHLAFDPDLYATWREFRHAQRDLAAEKHDAGATVTPINTPTSTPTPQARSWRPSSQVTTAVGLAIAASLAAVLLLPKMLFPPAPVDFWSNWQVPKNISARALDNDESVVLSVVLNGMHQQLQQQGMPTLDAAGDPLPQTDCGSVAECITVEQELLEFGRLLVSTRTQCLNTEPTTPASLRSLVALLPALQSVPATGLVHAPMRQMNQQAASLLASSQDTDTATALCLSVDTTIERVLLAR